MATSSNSRNVDQRLVRNQTDLFNSVSVPGKDKKVDPVGHDSTETTLSTIDGRLQICHSAKNSTHKIRIADPRFFRCHCESTTEDSGSFVNTSRRWRSGIIFTIIQLNNKLVYLTIGTSLMGWQLGIINCGGLKR